MSVTVAQSLDNGKLIDTTRVDIANSPRFEIVQSTIAVRATFKLDMYLGVVYQLKSRNDTTHIWERVTRLSGTLPDKWYINTRNYSIFLSTLGMKYIYLLNVHTGATWQFATNSKTNESFFIPMETN
jgi:hypothetical protein